MTLCSTVLRKAVDALMLCSRFENLFDILHLEVVKYFVSLDANKAFDKVLHSGLYLKLLQKGMHTASVKLLRYLYRHRVCAVLWNGVAGDTF